MKNDSLADYIARGGKITRIPTPEQNFKSESVKSTVQSGPAVLMTLDQADLFYGERKVRKVKPKLKPTIDLSALPPALRKKYVDDVIDANREGNDED
jgi:hypothetical protein